MNKNIYEGLDSKKCINKAYCQDSGPRPVFIGPLGKRIYFNNFHDVIVIDPVAGDVDIYGNQVEGVNRVYIHKGKDITPLLEYHPDFPGFAFKQPEIKESKNGILINKERVKHYIHNTVFVDWGGIGMYAYWNIAIKEEELEEMLELREEALKKGKPALKVIENFEDLIEANRNKYNDRCDNEKKLTESQKQANSDKRKALAEQKAKEKQNELANRVNKARTSASTGLNPVVAAKAKAASVAATIGSDEKTIISLKDKNAQQIIDIINSITNEYITTKVTNLNGVIMEAKVIVEDYADQLAQQNIEVQF